MTSDTARILVQTTPGGVEPFYRDASEPLPAGSDGAGLDVPRLGEAALRPRSDAS